jgi:BASS family bile acid:Na+ symporter
MLEKIIQTKNFLTTKGKGFSLLIAMLVGIFLPQAHQYDYTIQYLLIAMLFFAFLDIDLFHPRANQKGALWILLANLGIAFLVYGILAPFDHQIALAAFITAISPTAISSPVIVGFVDGDMEYIIAAVILTNIAVALVIPFALPHLAGAHIQIAAFDMLRSVAITMFVPMFLAQGVKALSPSAQKIIRKGKSLSMPLWLITLVIISAKASDFLRSENTASLATLGKIALVSLAIAMLNFGIGVRLGQPSRWRESGQALGQKNLSFTIWVALTFINPLVAMGPTFYILYHHIYNSWLIYDFEKRRIPSS